MVGVGKRLGNQMLQQCISQVLHDFTQFMQSYSSNSSEIAKNRKSAHKYLFIHLNYGQGKLVVSYDNTLVKYLPNFSQLYAVPVVLFPNQQAQTQKGKKAHSNTHSYTSIIEKAHWLFQTLLQGLHTDQVLVNPEQYLWWYPQSIVLCPKQAKSALKQLFQQLNYGLSAHIKLFSTTRKMCTPTFSQVHRVSVVLFIKWSSCTQNL